MPNAGVCTVRLTAEGFYLFVIRLIACAKSGMKATTFDI